MSNFKSKNNKIKMIISAVLLVAGLTACGSNGGPVETTKPEITEQHTSEPQTGEDIVIPGPNLDELYGNFPSSVKEFSVKDINGNTVTSDIFAEKDLTVINIWGTFCGPCINEMPELGDWARAMSDRVQIIGLVADITDVNDAETIELANEIVDKTGADYIHIIGGTGEFYDILSKVVGVPTTLFVDSSGKMVGQPIIGAYVDEYKAFVEEYLSENISK